MNLGGEVNRKIYIAIMYDNHISNGDVINELVSKYVRFKSNESLCDSVEVSVNWRLWS